MASFIDTLHFVVSYMWVKGKSKMFLILFCTLCYFIRINGQVKIFIAVNLLVFSIIMFLYLYSIDKPLRSNGFYQYFNIRNFALLISKLLFLGTVFIIQLSLFLRVIINSKK